MATLFSHAIVAGSLAQFNVARTKSSKLVLVLMLIAVALLPDIDVIAFKLGIAYQHPLGHRGFTHSLLFAGLLAIFCASVLLPFKAWWRFYWWWLVLLFFLATASHGLLDAMTDAGLGVGFFIPFDNTRYFLEWRPIETSPIGITQFFSHKAWSILWTEILYIWLPVLIASLLFQTGRRLACYWKSRNK